MGLAGFEPATSSARGWHHTKLDNNPNIQSNYSRPIIRYYVSFQNTINNNEDEEE
jgi:hypothetical protein